MILTKGKPKLIRKVEKTFLITKNPVYYHGMPDKHVYFVYIRPYITPGGQTRFEYVFSMLDEFSYNYKTETLIDSHGLVPFFPEESLTEYNQKITEIKVIKNINPLLENLRDIETQLSKAVTEYYRKLGLKAQQLEEKELKKHQSKEHKILSTKFSNKVSEA